MIHIYVGSTGNGKTYMSAIDVLELLNRNMRWFDRGKTNIKRIVSTNIKLADWVKEEYAGFYHEWSDLEQLVDLHECDVIFDDMATYLDSQRWSDTPMSVKRWLRLHEHYGCDIYGNAQDFLTIDPSVWRLTTSLHHVRKIAGSRRPSATKPKIKFIWGLLMIRQVRDEVIDKEKIKYEYSGIPKFRFIKKDICSVFDTTQNISEGTWPPLHHIERKCITCDEIKIRHV